MNNGGVLRMQIHHAVGNLQAHVGGMQSRQLQFSHVEEVVQGATGHVLSDEAQVRHLEASANETHQTLVAEVSEGLDLLRQVLHHQLCHSAIPIELLDRYLLPTVGAPENLAKLTRAKALDELEAAYLTFSGSVRSRSKASRGVDKRWPPVTPADVPPRPPLDGAPAADVAAVAVACAAAATGVVWAAGAAWCWCCDGHAGRGAAGTTA
eukprot:CAMPEP_0179145606 /NCGR_PEP_ID=MMETSP0796-20121207/70265_1 /TAXON_ID=73915 /ORGANISM="Pyrodinium bahamense, Strain pbaha01" /LENGTH=208 /DNA_ID=CAMNT_0020846019 /DNA_START=571 /DNA_END=1194 /DNA_ORIENTATION=+